MGFKKNPYDLCSCMRTTCDDVCTIFVYDDDLFIMSGNKTHDKQVISIYKYSTNIITCSTHAFLISESSRFSSSYPETRVCIKQPSSTLYLALQSHISAPKCPCFSYHVVISNHIISHYVTQIGEVYSWARGWCELNWQEPSKHRIKQKKHAVFTAFPANQPHVLASVIAC